MVSGTKSLCAVLVGDQADIAGEIVAADAFRLLAAGDDSTIDLGDGGHQNVLERIHAADGRQLTDCAAEVLADSGPQQVKSRVRLSEDEWCIFEFRIYPRGHFAADSAPIFTGTNVTDDHFLTQRREVINRVLRHNLRNDMEIITGYTDLARAQCECESEAPFDEIQAISQRLLSLGEQMRAIDSRLNSSNYRFRRVNLREVIDRAVADAHEAHPEVTFRVYAGPHRIAGNSLVSTAVEELIENAIEHSDKPPEDVVITIETEESEATDEVTLRILDNGVGIPQSEIDAISEGTESKLNHGSGLGLWLVKWISDSVHATFDIRQRSGTTGTIGTLGFNDADRMDGSDEAPFTELHKKKIIRTTLPSSGSADIATSTRG
ncbi:HAMP domain-containing histidine kinase [Halonotius terrestris]|uniref:histidine kinase n=1 Tax=Halonotius terrestris TaxID=2487750 RepID=A0A8J8PBR2_9EURY|nr:HAMP domain-containing sensor histidine kinase [Halonotius terrestris]TQQ83654.1 HAMP domain-containing histidine kinase [Halonotius terrestris]